MRPTARPQSALRCPLNRILGTEANVRVLRVLFRSDVPVGVSVLARLSQLQPSGVARVCTRLEGLGVIEALERGARNRQYRRAARFPLASSLSRLFRAESSRANRVMNEVQTAVQSGATGLRAAWIEGPTALGNDRPGDAIVVGLLADPAAVDSVRVAVGQRLLPLQSNHDVVIELKVVTIADLTTANAQELAQLEQARPLVGPPPADVLRAHRVGRGTLARRKKRHEHLDLRSKEIARLVAERIDRDPSIVEDARRYVERRLLSASPGERLELREWQNILNTMSIPRLRRFLVQDDARATRLRQSSPFLNALSQEERRSLFESAVQRR